VDADVDAVTDGAVDALAAAEVVTEAGAALGDLEADADAVLVALMVDDADAVLVALMVDDADADALLVALTLDSADRVDSNCARCCPADSAAKLSWAVITSPSCTHAVARSASVYTGGATAPLSAGPGSHGHTLSTCQLVPYLRPAYVCGKPEPHGARTARPCTGLKPFTRDHASTLTPLQMASTCFCWDRNSPMSRLTWAACAATGAHASAVPG
jgi:hypothetical protein